MTKKKKMSGGFAIGSVFDKNRIDSETPKVENSRKEKRMPIYLSTAKSWWERVRPWNSIVVYHPNKKCCFVSFPTPSSSCSSLPSFYPIVADIPSRLSSISMVMGQGGGGEERRGGGEGEQLFHRHHPTTQLHS